eukprot:scaffold536068_cov35-Prasinocladus_malaysianus.AAC.1
MGSTRLLLTTCPVHGFVYSERVLNQQPLSEHVFSAECLAATLLEPHFGQQLCFKSTKPCIELACLLRAERGSACLRCV